MTFRVLDPTAGEARRRRPARAAPRHARGQDRRLHLQRQGRHQGLLRPSREILREEYGVANVVSRTKSNYSAPADAHIVAEIKQWDAVVSGIGD